MAILGVLSVLGSAQALAQDPEIDSVKYVSTTTRTITVMTNVPVYLRGSLQNLAYDFELSGGTLGTGTQRALQVTGLRTDSVPGSGRSACDSTVPSP